MQIASKQCVWQSGGVGVEVVVEMTPETGRLIRFFTGNVRGEECSVDWGDGGGKQAFVHADVYKTVEHMYPTYGRYKIVFRNISNIGFRWLDGQSPCAYDGAILSVVDYDGTLTGAHSGAFTGCENLERYVAPNNQGCGQRPFAYCTSLKEVQIGRASVHFDGAFENCTSLVKFTAERTWTCWRYVWKGCTSLTELRLGDVNQFATDDFYNTPNLKDIWIANKTVDQIKQAAASGNIVGGYNAKFPWGACADCRFHGTDGIVLGNGTVIRE